MIPASFDYEVAESAEHAVSLLAERDESKLLAGGHSLLPAMKLRIARPSCLIDIAGLTELATCVTTEIGSPSAPSRGTRMSARLAAREHCPIVSFTAGQVGDPQVRHRGTIGGSVSHSDPARTSRRCSSRSTRRWSYAARTVSESSPPSTCTGVFQIALGEGEMLVEIRVPKLGASTGWSYVKMARRAQDWATVGVAAVVERSNGDIERARSRSRTWARRPCGPGPQRGRSRTAPGSSRPRSSRARAGTCPPTRPRAPSSVLIWRGC